MIILCRWRINHNIEYLFLKDKKKHFRGFQGINENGKRKIPKRMQTEI